MDPIRGVIKLMVAGKFGIIVPLDPSIGEVKFNCLGLTDVHGKGTAVAFETAKDMQFPAKNVVFFPTERKRCYHYLLGRCTYYDSCHFLHSNRDEVVEQGNKRLCEQQVGVPKRRRPVSVSDDPAFVALGSPPVSEHLGDGKKVEEGTAEKKTVMDPPTEENSSPTEPRDR